MKLSDDLSRAEQVAVWGLVEEYADGFALSVHEVKHIPRAVQMLYIPEDAELSKKIGQKPLTPPQASYFSKALDVMIDTGICTPIKAKDVKCVSPITLSAKSHSTVGMTMDELCEKVNHKWEHIRLRPPFIGPPRPPHISETDTHNALTSHMWQVCMDYRNLNKVTKVLPMPQGNIHTKQQALLGHRWVLIFDFATGFYTMEIDPES